MTHKLEVDADPAELGLDAGRLGRVDAFFRRYVDDGLLPGWLIAVMRDGRLGHLSTYGWRDVETRDAVTTDTVWRIYSMTKPITTVAALMLWEEGAFELKDPVSRFIPAFGDLKVWRAGSVTNPVLDPLTEEMAIWHLMTHTSGLTYGFMFAHSVDELYRRAGFEWGVPPSTDLAGVVDTLAGLPLLFQPGAEWNYSMATDVLGRVVEVAAGAPLDEVLRTRVLEPLGMHETGFSVPAESADRLVSLYGPHPATKQAVKLDQFGKAALRPPAALLGGGGLVSTAADYLRFAEMLRRRGELDGTRLLSPRTVEYMASNHLPGGADLTEFGRPLFSETTFDGVGFGLGVSVTVDPVAAKVPGSVGDFGWGGAASTTFWVDPVEDMTVLMMTQLLPSSTHPLRSQLKQLVHQALVD
ncbi:MAG: serine hydrolase domain-containing protein [Ilumatobacteraceae bacterium]|nr:MAG: beta-lactamase family protein [Actinomycetota bacterium]